MAESKIKAPTVPTSVINDINSKCINVGTYQIESSAFASALGVCLDSIITTYGHGKSGSGGLEWVNHDYYYLVFVVIGTSIIGFCTNGSNSYSFARTQSATSYSLFKITATQQ